MRCLSCPLISTSLYPQAIPWIIHVIDVWTRSPLFLAQYVRRSLLHQTFLFSLITFFVEILLFVWPSLHHHNRNFSSIASGVRLLQQAFVFAPVARPDLKNLYLDPILVPFLIHYPLLPHPTISPLLSTVPPGLPYHPPMQDQAPLPCPVRLRCTCE